MYYMCWTCKNPGAILGGVLCLPWSQGMVAELVWLVVPYDGGSCMMDGVHSLVCSVLGSVGFVQLHLMAFMAHSWCLVEELHLQLGNCQR